MTNRLLKIYMIFALLTFLIPCCAGAGARMLTSNSRGEPSETDAEAVAAQPDRVSVYLTDSGEVVNMDFEEYIVGVLAAKCRQAMKSKRSKLRRSRREAISKPV